MFVFVLFRFYYRGWRGLGETFLSLLQKPIWPLSHLLVRFSIVSWADVTWGDPQKSWLLGKACRDLLLKSPNSVGICTHLFDLFLFHLVVVEQISLIHIKMADSFSHHYSPLFYPSTQWILTQKWWHQKWNMEIFRQSPNLLLSFFFRIFHIIIFQSGAKCLRKSFTYFPCWKISLHTFLLQGKKQLFFDKVFSTLLNENANDKTCFWKMHCTLLLIFVQNVPSSYSSVSNSRGKVCATF